MQQTINTKQTKNKNVSDRQKGNGTKERVGEKRSNNQKKANGTKERVGEKRSNNQIYPPEPDNGHMMTQHEAGGRRNKHDNYTTKKKSKPNDGQITKQEAMRFETKSVMRKKNANCENAKHRER